MYDQEQNDSHPPSGESPARQTPQPPLPNPNKEMQVAFAKQVAQAIGKDEVSAVEELEQPPVLDHMGHSMYQPPPQAVHQRYDTLVQSSKLQVYHSKIMDEILKEDENKDSMAKYVSQAPVRAPTQNFYARAPPPSSQTPRMVNHRQGQQPLYQTRPTQFVPMALQPPMYHLTTSTPVQYFNGGPRPQASYVPSGYQMIPSQTITYQYPQAPTQPQAAYFYSASQLLQRPPPPVATAPQTPTQPRTKNKRRSRAIPIIDPNTGKGKLSELYDQEQNDSHPPSGESSARQTPQPPLPNPNKEVQAAFAKQVAQAIGKDEVSAVEELEQPPVLDHMGHSMYQPPPQAVHQRYDTLVQSSKLQELYKKVRCVHNKSTIQKFETLLRQVRSLRIDTAERLQGVTDLVFEKAVNEPDFSVACALLCRELALMQVPATGGKRKEGQEFVSFRKLLVTRCQLEFEKHFIDETERNRKIKEIEECSDLKKKKDIQLDLDEYDRRLRMKSVGNMKFIGELFKQQMLTVNVMLRCVNNLLDTKDEESLECLCKLLTTVGKELESKKVDLGPIFSSMKDIASQKHEHIGNRVRFLVQDVIDLRASRWVPRKQDLVPKSLDQINKEAEHEHHMMDKPSCSTQTFGNSGCSTRIETQCQQRLRMKIEKCFFSCYTITECDKYIQTSISPSEHSQLVSVWYIEFLKLSKMQRFKIGFLFAYLIKVGTFSLTDYCIGLEDVLEQANMLKNVNVWDDVAELICPILCEDSEKLDNFQNVFELVITKEYSSQLLFHLLILIIGEKRKTFFFDDSIPTTNAPPVVVSENSENQAKNILEEYLNGHCNLQECEQYIKDSISPCALPKLVSEGYMSVLEKSNKSRLQTGFLFAHLLQWGTLSLQSYCMGLTTVLEEANEFVFDVPDVWNDVAELVYPVLCETAKTPKYLRQLFDFLVKSDAMQLLSCLFKMFIKKKCANLHNSWGIFGLTPFGHLGRSEADDGEEGLLPYEEDYRSRDSSTASQRNTTPAPVPSAPKAQPSTGAPPVPAPIELTPEQLERKLKNILEEYLNNCCTVDECDQDIKISISSSVLPQLVSDGYISVLERSKTARLRTGYLFAQLIKLGTLSLQDYCVGLEAVLEEADELIIDIPRVWDYVAELISPVLCEGSATLTTLHKLFELLVSKNHASNLLACLFKLIIQEKGPNFLQSSWNSSGFTFANYMAESQVDSYVKENNFEFLLEAGDSSPVSQSHSPLLGQSQLSYEEIHEKLLAFFKSGTSFDDIINWIAANVGDRVKENQFIRTLATACFNDSIVNMKLKADILQGKYNLLHRFVDNKPAYELQCLYALQALINKLEHPQGLLLAICDKLYEENAFSHESFVAWEASKDPVEQEGKGVALKQLTSFFTQLKEADEDSSSSEDA